MATATTGSRSKLDTCLNSKTHRGATLETEGMRPDIIEMFPGKAVRLDGYEGYVLSATSAVSFALIIEGQVQANLEIATLPAEWLTLDTLIAPGFLKRRAFMPFIQFRFTSGTARVMIQKYPNFADAMTQVLP